MANGFPKPRSEPALPALSGLVSPTVLPRQARRSPLRSRPLLCGLALLALAGAGAGLASHSIGAESGRPLPSPSPPSAVATTTTHVAVLPRRNLPSVAQPIGAASVPLASLGIAAIESEPEANTFRGVGPGVPEAYTGDPAGQALWDKTVEEDQTTIQPDDLIEEPPVPKLDLSKNPAYQALHLDADGNTNEP